MRHKKLKPFQVSIESYFFLKFSCQNTHFSEKIAAKNLT